MENPSPDLQFIRIHHFFDILRDFGLKKDFDLDPVYLHSYHIIANGIRKNARAPFKIVIGADSICEGCIHLKQGLCRDKIIKPGFLLKNDYNNYLDLKILRKMNICENEITTPLELCRNAWKYIDHIFSIYDLNDPEYTFKRKKGVLLGLDYYRKLHGFEIDLK